MTVTLGTHDCGLQEFRLYFQLQGVCDLVSSTQERRGWLLVTLGLLCHTSSVAGEGTDTCLWIWRPLQGWESLPPWDAGTGARRTGEDGDTLDKSHPTRLPEEGGRLTQSARTQVTEVSVDGCSL